MENERDKPPIVNGWSFDKNGSFELTRRTRIYKLVEFFRRIWESPSV